ncbi:MAG: DNA repair protein RadA [bacterium]|nr:DNA repair protein RadA [bacterium]
MKLQKTKTQYICQECGHACPKWQGQCPACQSWNTLLSEVVPATPTKGAPRMVTQAVALNEVSLDESVRRQSGIAEFDRILGGGLIPGQVVLVGGDPGIGKSTILLQAANALAAADAPLLYVSGEESLAQTKLRAQRLHVDNPNILLMAATDIRAILEEVARVKPFAVVIDSIQVMYDSEYPSSPGSVTQVRECAAQLVRFAKEHNVAVLIVGHVTKTGAIAGPRVVEHLVDTVLYFEGERHNIYRILRAVKNRFGSTDEIGVFEMTGRGLIEVPNPSAIFLAQRQTQRSGSAVGTAIEGTRPLLIEVQALVASSPFGMPARKAVGVDANRITLLLAVLEKRVGIHVNTQDVFVSLAGGIKLTEPGLDLACVAAIASSFYDRPVPDDTVVIGEVGLGGEVRAVSQIERRVMESKRLGFAQCILPAHNLKSFREKGKAQLQWQGVKLVGCEDVRAALQALLGTDAVNAER